MTADLLLQPTPDAALLGNKRLQLATLRKALAERESQLAQLRAQLKNFEDRYLRQVGVLYAELDELEARIAEREVALYDSNSARQRAEEARQRAQETHDAAFGEASETPATEPPSDLKALFRDVAKRIHPDLARDAAEAQHLTLLMVRANQAYSRGDLHTLQRMLDDQLEILADFTHAEDTAAEILRVTRQIRHGERDLAQLEAEEHTLLAADIAQLYAEAAAASADYRDLLTELAAGLQEQIEEARRRFELIDRQITAHGR